MMQRIENTNEYNKCFIFYCTEIYGKQHHNIYVHCTANCCGYITIKLYSTTMRKDSKTTNGKFCYQLSPLVCK